MFRISFVYLLLYVLYMQKFLKKCIPAITAGVQNWGRMSHLPDQQGPLLENSYISLFSVMALH